MQLLLFKTLWGHTGTLDAAIDAARENGFNGLEAVPPPHEKVGHWQEKLADSGLKYLAEIPTTGDYVPVRSASVGEHLESLQSGLETAKKLGAIKANCVGGCDAWPVSQSVEFFGRALELAREIEISICFETHRSRSLFTPWSAREILEQLPLLRLTCDFSHWCAVLERLPDSEAADMELCFARADHIHARVGWAQGAQVTDPRLPEFENELRAHESWWQKIWQHQKNSGAPFSTMTPEWGPDGYCARTPFTLAPVADVTQINSWMATRERAHFAEFSA